MSRPKISTNVNLTIALPPEYFGLLTIIDKTASEQGTTRSVIARDLLCESLEYNPKVERKMYEYKTVPVRVRKDHRKKQEVGE